MWPDVVALDAALDAVSDPAWDAGLRLLQGRRLGATDEVHVAELMGMMRPPEGASIADLGCGFGEVARIAHRLWPDLEFVLVNRSARQMERAPSRFRRIIADAQALPLADASVDGAMLLYSLCHMDPAAALAEAARITRPGGFLFVFDFERLAGGNDAAERVLMSRFHTRAELRATAEAAGWRTERPEGWMFDPGGDDALFRSLFPDASAYEAIFRDLRPLAWRAVRA